ncbi:MAG: class I SAM-dependent methyltransferase [Streptosporangiaceae bacterium]
MVGDQGAPSAAAAALTGQVRDAYEAAQQDWAAGPQLVYAALARSLLAQAAPWVAGQHVLDAGAGTGLAGQAALELGARRVVAADLAPGLLRQAGPRLHPVVASMYALPFGDRSFGLVAAAFSLSHLSDLGDGLAELRRVGRAIAVSTFAPGWTHPCKAAVDDVLAQSGYRPPSWYLAMKNEGEPRLADTGLFRQSALAAGFDQVESRTVTVPTSLSSPEQLAAWRLGLAHVAPYVRSLDQRRQRALLRAARQAVQAVADCPPLVVSMLVYLAS